MQTFSVYIYLVGRLYCTYGRDLHVYFVIRRTIDILFTSYRSGNKTKQQRKHKYSTDTIAASSMSSHHQSLTLLHSRFYDPVAAMIMICDVAF